MATSVGSEIATNAIPFDDTAKREGTERTMVQRAQRGDPEAFEALFLSHKSRVFSVCLLMTKDVAEAEDMTQEAFLQVFRNVREFRGDSAFSTWLHRIAVNAVLMKLRRCKGPPVLSLDEPVSPHSPSLRRDVGKCDPVLSSTIDRILLCRAIQELPAGCRRVFRLHTVQGYKHEEIARMLHCSIGNSKAQLHKAKAKMRDLLLPKRRSRRRNSVSTTSRGSAAAGTNQSPSNYAN